MSRNQIRSLLKPIILQVAPRVYYRRLVRQGIEEQNFNTREIIPVISIKYDSFGKYPTMYERPPSFYEKKKRGMHFDVDGIPLVLYKGDPIYHPIFLIQYGLSEYGFYVSTLNKNHLFAAKKISDWLLNNQDKTNGLWYYPFDYLHEMTNFLIKTPWSSAMAQGQAISLLTRIYKEFEEDKYLNAAIKATSMLDIPVSSGGLSAKLWDHTVFEEYPTNPNSFTLNGFMFCALGLYDLSTVTDHHEVQNLWRIAKDTLQFIIPLYDGDIMSSYCLSHITMGNIDRHWANQYHPLHIILLQCFESIMPNQTFKYYIKRWAHFMGLEIVDASSI